MATFTRFNVYSKDLMSGVHDFTTHTLKVALSNTPPLVANAVLADITQITNGGGYLAGGYTLDGVTLSETGGVSKVVITDEVITASGAPIAAFQYLVIYNDTSASPADPLIGFIDRGSALTLADGESLTLDFNAATGALSAG